MFLINQCTRLLAVVFVLWIYQLELTVSIVKFNGSIPKSVQLDKKNQYFTLIQTFPKRQNNQYPFVVIMIPDDRDQFPKVQMIAAFEIALSVIKKWNINSRIKQMRYFSKVESHCYRVGIAQYYTVKLLVETKPSAWFGPFCDYNIAPIARLLPFYNTPIITPGGLAYNFRIAKRLEYSTLTRTGDVMINENMVFFFRKIIQMFSWDNAIMVYEKTAMNSCRALGILFDLFSKDNNVKVFKNIYIYNQNTLFTEQFNGDYSVIVLCVNKETLRTIMLKAHSLNYINGEYVFINVNIFGEHFNSRTPWYKKDDSEKKNNIARKAFRALLEVSLKTHHDAEVESFYEQIKRRSNITDSETPLSVFVSAFHDSLLLYALALNDTIARNRSIDDGEFVTQMMWNRTFNGIGGSISIDDNGDRKVEYVVRDMDKNSGRFVPVLNYVGKEKKLKLLKNSRIDWINADNKPPPDKPLCGFDNRFCPKKFELSYIAIIVMAVLLFLGLIIAYFVYKRLKFKAELKAMNWLINWDSIETREKRSIHLSSCRPNPTTGVCTAPCDEPKKVVVISTSSNMETDLQPPPPSSSPQSQTTKVNENLDPGVVVKRFQPTTLRALSHTEDEHNSLIKDAYENDKEKRLSINASLSSWGSVGGIRLMDIQGLKTFTKTAVYKGSIVALKTLHGHKKVEINKLLLIEVKRVKDLNNEHICRFIGVCLDAPVNNMIVMEYCPKGSLQDILENDQISLDWVFKYSLIQDICRGMLYLHSNIGAHGNLKSSNCLVDSRFVLKITDFGLETLRGSKVHLLNNDVYAFYRHLLWTAPEHLRELAEDYSENRIVKSVKGDVYSFGIMCQEVIYRQGVFFLGELCYEPREIIERVRYYDRNMSAQPFRPMLNDDNHYSSEELRNIVQQTWLEDSYMRPDFRTVKSMMKNVNKEGDSGNILDNLLSRMEQYANNLEDLVNQRTEQYLDEKRKTEDLLYSMLPKSVAGQLIRNETVTAESYEMVTIYFSDIVGFTSLSAESTPMQIIGLLNRLYTLFDSIIEGFDVYKVETIGDAYMVCSGLPQRNGNIHIREIARMSLAFLSAIFEFEIPHMPGRRLELRIGIHSGSVCAGVVGLKMPRYCLFGDTVNTASRMESNGLPLKIHISQEAVNVLTTFPMFVISKRGEVNMKGKGAQTTYWLHGEGTNIIDPIAVI